MAENNCRLVLVDEIINQFRFRTINDFNHGTLLPITVKLEGYLGMKSNVIVLCTIYQEHEHVIYPHPNLLIISGSRGRITLSDPISSELNDDSTATFSGMIIVRPKISNISQSLIEKFERIRVYKPYYMNNNEMINIDHGIFDMKNIKLCFEAFERNGPEFVSICDPVFSGNIAHSCRPFNSLQWYCVNLCGKATGNDRMIVVCNFAMRENIRRENIRVRFYEIRSDGSVWEAYANIEYIDFCNHSLIITTPPYENPNITEDKNVYFELCANTPRGWINSDSKVYIYVPS